MILKVQKANSTYISNPFSEKKKILVQNTGKKIKAKALKIGDFLHGGYIVLDIIPSEKTKNEDIILTNFDQLFSELSKEFLKETVWDFENKEAQNILKKYNVEQIDSLYNGLKFKTKTGAEQFLPETFMKQDTFTLNISNLNQATLQCLD